MYRRRAALASLAVLATLACASARAQSEPKGWVVASIACENSIVLAEVAITLREDSNRRFITASLGALFGPDPLELDGRKGFVRAIALPAGAYRMVNFRLEESVAQRKWSSRKDFDKPFEVRPGEVTYLGEFVGTGTLSKPFLGVRAIEKPYFLVSDRRERDMAFAEKDKPELKGMPVRNLAPFLTPGGPNVFLTKKLPDAE